MDPDDLEATLLGAPCELTRDDVADAVGIPEPQARSLWNAMGFPDVGPAERAFTSKDVEALRTALELAATGVVDADTVMVLARSMGHELPDVRAGVALGPLLVRLGDVYGAPVNLASRLTDEARPRTVLVDQATADALADDASYELKRLRRRSVRGYRSLTPHLLRRTSVDA
ncbi:MAG: hypothetical protein LH469_04885 [Frankiaceae bacterium]|nr:hypothetical protein [Frankiaceae bacterium]